MIQVFAVPNPPAGQDWTYTIPGQYVEAITAVTATLAPLSNPLNAVDSSGNGNTAAYDQANANILYGVTGPYAGGTQGFAAQETVASSDVYLAEFANSGGQFDLATYSADAIVNFTGNGNFTMNEILAVRTSDVNLPSHLRFLYGLSRTGAQVIANTNTNVFTLTGVGISLNTWTHVGFSYDGTQWIGYKNGVAGTAVAGNAPGTFTTLPATIGGDLISSQNLDATIAAVAFYSGALSAARFLAHSNAIATSDAAYKAAVLADSPVALWMLEEKQQTFQRATNLQVTDGTHTVARFPGYAPSQQSPVFNWAWLSQVASNVQDPGQIVTTIAIPELVLPAGYTIGTQTPDLSAMDQWSNIRLWVDTNYSGQTGGVNPFVYPPGAKLVYQQEQVNG